ncbi:unnamed protein product [Debaryomyces tyrocola]|nr:unnamed protein product [Debaryomyces tyrocola]
MVFNDKQGMKIAFEEAKKGWYRFRSWT